VVNDGFEDEDEDEDEDTFGWGNDNGVCLFVFPMYYC